jgi:zinc transporter ZupT
MEPLFFALASFISTVAGGLFSLKQKNHLHYVMSFTAGVIIAVCFFEILPEMFALTTEHHLDITTGLIAIVTGFLTIHILEKAAVIHTNHETLVGSIGASGLSFHSFLDGIGIGLGFHINPQIGLLIALAVIAHDFSDGINTVTLMLVNKNSQKNALKFLFLDAAAPVLGVVSTFFFTIPVQVLQLYLGFFIGFLLYIGASDLLPEAHSKHSSWRMLLLTVSGVLFIFLITRIQ